MIEPLRKQMQLQGETIVIDWLMYRSYEFNRFRKPEIDPERWRAIYFNADVYEKIYQQNLRGIENVSI